MFWQQVWVCLQNVNSTQQMWHKAGVLTSVQVQTARMTANEGPYYSFLYSCDMLYYWFRWHDGQGISSNVCTGAVPDQPLHYESQTAKLIFFYMPCLSEIIKCLGGMPSIFSSPRVCGVFASAAACAILPLFFYRMITNIFQILTSSVWI